MPNYSTGLDTIYRAIAHSTRRAMLEQLLHGPAAVSDLAEPFDLALPSFMQHLRVLEKSGLVRTEKRGRIRTVYAVPGELDRAGSWISTQRRLWETRLDQMDDHLTSLKESSDAEH